MTIDKRKDYIDVIAGIMICWMIFGHCRFFSGYILPFPNFLGFYMPWFYYKSGYFFSTTDSKSLMKKDYKKLVLRFVVYSFIGWLVWCLCSLAGHTTSLKSCIRVPILLFIKEGCFIGNNALWFLLSLFFVKQFGNLLLKKKYPPPPLFNNKFHGCVSPLLCWVE